ncbi:MAG: TonB family protein [Calditrichaeota bacterium]|nr:TonB family protein [Calditrichota bacterium]
MERFSDMFSDIRKTLVLSAGIHLLLLLLFLGIGVGIDFSSPEFAEIGFVASSRGARPRSVRRQTNVVTPRPKPKRPKAAPTQTTQPKAEPVNLPKRRMLEEEKPQVINRETGKLSPTEDQTKISPADQVYEARQIGRDIAATREGERVTGNLEETVGEAKETAPSEDVGTPGTNQPFTIEGDAAKRTIVNQKIPRYPSGLQREAVVKIRFTVLPDGHVGIMLPIQKGDPTLDEITMQALRQWRFNPLPPGAEQKNVQGIITFRYELQ